MTEAQRAHLRMMESTPQERVHTHLQEARPLGSGCLPRGRTKEDTARLNHAINALKRKGLKQFEIARELNVSRMTVSVHLRGRIKAVR